MSRLYVLLATCALMALVCMCFVAWRIKKEGYSVQDMEEFEDNQRSQRRRG
ncbi:MAG: hypothetical protein JSV72_11690 [Ralstonia sp.]|jgi:hypothetical protein|nr:MAG: hypothetical protein JSV72_11690 [Ralstonia sp.]